MIEISDAKPNYELLWLRDYAKHTQAEAAKMLKVNRVSYARWESGARITPKEAVRIYAEALGIPMTDLPADAKAAVEHEQWLRHANAEADLFALEVTRFMGSPGQLKAEKLVFERGLDAADLPRLPPIDIPPHLFRPSSLKKFNVPESRWIELVVEIAGECVADLKLGGYSWDQAVTWKDADAKAQGYALLKLWEEARDLHFAERCQHAREEKIAMPCMVYTRVVELFDKLLDRNGWGLV